MFASLLLCDSQITDLPQFIAHAFSRPTFSPQLPPPLSPPLPPPLLPLLPQVKEKKSLLARLETMDMGKPIAEAEWDMDEVAGCFVYYAGTLLTWEVSLCHCRRLRPLACETVGL